MQRSLVALAQSFQSLTADRSLENSVGAFHLGARISHQLEAEGH
jgi:hypothetical protein